MMLSWLFSDPLPVGSVAPEFSAPDQTGRIVTLSALRGRNVVLVFYPGDDTPGCTKQLCEFRDGWEQAKARGVEVFGVSPDSVASHVKFRKKFDLPYRLLADVGHPMADAFGTWVEKSFAGKTYKGVERTSFIIGPDGRVEHTLPRVKPIEHVDLLMERLAA